MSELTGQINSVRSGIGRVNEFWSWEKYESTLYIFMHLQLNQGSMKKQTSCHDNQRSKCEICIEEVYL